jgi:hypothetical protein
LGSGCRSLSEYLLFVSLAPLSGPPSLRPWSPSLELLSPPVEYGWYRRCVLSLIFHPLMFCNLKIHLRL